MDVRPSLYKVLNGFEKKNSKKHSATSLLKASILKSPEDPKSSKSFAARVAVPLSQSSLLQEPHALVPLPISWGYAITMGLMTVTLIAPIRLLASAITMVLTSVLAHLVKRTLNKPHQVPSSRERILQALILVGVRLQLFFMGVHYIHVERKGKQISKLLVCNHITAMDSFILAWVEHTRCIIDADFFSKPFVGTVLRALQFLDMSSRICKFGGDPDHGRDMIKDALHSGHPDPILVFPQGTTSRQDIITEFQDYTFSIPNQYITPVVLKFYNRSSPFTPWLHHNHWLHCYFLCCNIDNSLNVVFGEPVRPSGCVRNFKEKVQGQMAMLLHGSITRHGYPDSLLLSEVIKSHIQVNNLDKVIVRDWLDNFHLTNEDILKALRQFADIDLDASGSVDYNEFCAYFRINPKKLKTLQLFRCLDESGSLTIEFYEFLTAYAISRKSSSRMAGYLFQVCDTNGEGKIGLQNFFQVFCNPEDKSVHEFAVQFFSQLRPEEKIDQREWLRRIKQSGLEATVGVGIQNIFQQNHVEAY